MTIQSLEGDDNPRAPFIDFVTTIKQMAQTGLSPEIGKSSPGPYGTLEQIVSACDDVLTELDPDGE